MSRFHNDAGATRLFESGVHATGAATVQRSAMDLYGVWRRLDLLPLFIDGLRSVELVEKNRSRWTVDGPGSRTYAWEAEIIADEPGRMVAWKTLPGSDVQSAGTVRFEELPFDRGTEVRVTIEWVPPGKALGAAVARATGDDARTRIHGALHRLRQLMETGEISTTAGQPVGGKQRRKGAEEPERSRVEAAQIRSIAGERSAS